jgi:hypothetical protein
VRGVEAAKRRWWWGKRRHYRGSRAAQRLAAFEEEARSWPGWVRVWGFHPGNSRTFAHSYLDRHFSYIIALLVVLGVIYLFGTSLHAGHVILLGLIILLSSTAIWLFLVIRWIDQHGRWAGQYKTPH